MVKLQDLRKEALLSQDALAKRAKVSKSSVVRMEQGNHRTEQDIAEKVVKALSKELGRPIVLGDVEGLTLYNVMRDRRNRSKSS